MALTRLNNNAYGETISVAKGGTGVTTAADLANTGNLVLLNTNDISSAVSSIEFNSTYINSSYDSYLIIGDDIQCTADTTYGIILSSDNGSTKIARLQHRGRYHQLNADTTGHNSGTITIDSTTAPLLGECNNGKATNFIFELFNVNTSTGRTNLRTMSMYENGAGVPYRFEVGVNYNNTSAINYLKIGLSTSTLSGGKVSLYGVKT